MTQPTAEQLEVTQADRYAATIDGIIGNLLTRKDRSTQEIGYALNEAFARHRLQTEARMSAAVEAERARCSKLAADYAASMKPTVILGDDDSIYLTDHEQGQKDAAKRLSIMIYETAIRSQSNG